MDFCNHKPKEFKQTKPIALKEVEKEENLPQCDQISNPELNSSASFQQHFLEI